MQRTKMTEKKLSLTQFMELLLSLVQSGYPLPGALRILYKKEGAKRYAKRLLEVIEGGGSFSQALTGISSKLERFETLLESAEECGDIVPALSAVFEELKESDEDRRNFSIASLYPSVVCLLALVLSVGMIKLGLPYINLIAEVNEERLVKMIIAANIFLAVSVTVLCISTYLYSRRFDFQYFLFENLYFLNKSSVAMEEAFCVLLGEKSFSKRELKTISFILRGLRDGRNLYELVEESGCFDSFTQGWLYIAGESGDTQKGFLRIYENYKARKKRAREKSQRLLEPALTAVAGVYVLILIAGCMVPLFMTLGSKII